jgi:hypothetical protein
MSPLGPFSRLCSSSSQRLTALQHGIFCVHSRNHALVNSRLWIMTMHQSVSGHERPGLLTDVRRCLLRASGAEPINHVFLQSLIDVLMFLSVIGAVHPYRTTPGPAVRV